MNKYGKISIISASLLLPVTLLLSGFVAWQLKESNPNNVDITANLAYLKQILGTTLVSGGVMALISLASGVVGLKKDRARNLSKLGLAILGTVLVVSILAGIANSKAGDAEEAYRNQQTQAEKLKSGN